MIPRLLTILLGGFLWCSTASAAPCVLPYVLQNGTIPNATQVMADFYALLNCINTGPGGTIISVAETVPVEFLIAGSPVTPPGGTLAITKATELANTVWAGPTSGGPAIPAFRPLGANDLPCSILPAGGCPFDIVMFMPGVPAASAIVDLAIVRAATCVAGFTGSVGKAGTASTGTAIVFVKQNGSSTGSMTFTTSATGTPASGSGMTLASGDVVQFLFPASPDATLADVAITLKCART